MERPRRIDYVNSNSKSLGEKITSIEEYITDLNMYCSNLENAFEDVCNDLYNDYRFNVDKDSPKYNWSLEDWKEHYLHD